MRRLLMVAGVGLTVVLGAAVPASAATPQSDLNCFNNDVKQYLNGAQAGGAKAGYGVPPNCNQYYQSIGVIGSGR